MRWITHTGVAVAVAGVCGAPAGMLAGIAAGSVLPDVIDRLVAGKNQQLWRKIHRGTSHWWGWYVLLAVFAATMGNEFDELVRSLLKEILGGLPREFSRMLQQSGTVVLGLALGALSHVALDALNPSGVPIWPHGGNPRVRSKLVSTGTWREYIFLLVALLLLGVNYEEVALKLLRW